MTTGLIIQVFINYIRGHPSALHFSRFLKNQRFKYFKFRIAVEKEKMAFIEKCMLIYLSYYTST